MRGLTLLLLLTSSAAAQNNNGVLVALSGDVNPVLYRLNPATGAVLGSTPVTGHQAIIGGIAYSDTGHIFCIDGFDDGLPDRLLRISITTGLGTVLGSTGLNWSRRGLYHTRFTSDVRLYAIGDNGLYSISPTTGQTAGYASLHGSPRLDQATALAAHTFGNVAYITDVSDTDLFSLNITSGQVTWIGSIGGDPFTDLTIDRNTPLYGVRASGLFQINTTTAAATLMAPGNFSAIEYVENGAPLCYANCDDSTTPPVLSPNDFMCFFNWFALGDTRANCNGVHGFQADDFICFVNSYASGCY
jgi:hypothetical protein